MVDEFRIHWSLLAASKDSSPSTMLALIVARQVWPVPLADS